MWPSRWTRMRRIMGGRACRARSLARSAHRARITDRVGYAPTLPRSGGGEPLDSARIDHNTAPDGGGISLASPGLTMSANASIDSNTATNSGGGIYISGAPVLTNVVCGGTVHDNTPDDMAPICPKV